MRFALVGAGVIGAVHARLVTTIGESDPSVQLAAVVDEDLDKAETLAGKHGGRAFANLADALAAEAVDAVAVCLPSALHADAATEALAAGRHVLIEKPVDITLSAADRIVAAQRGTGLTVSVISQRRFQAPAAFIKDSVEAGRLGRITSGIAESAFYRSQEYFDSGDWRGTAAVDGGGALMNQGIHALDLLLWMLGKPVQVSAQTGRLAHEAIEVEDLAAATIRFESGAFGLVLASTAAYPGLPVRLTVHGDRGSAVMADDRLEYFHSADPAAPVAPPELPLRDGWSPVDAAHLAQYEDFVTAVRTGREPAVTLGAGRRALAVVRAVYQSADEGRPVDLQEV